QDGPDRRGVGEGGARGGVQGAGRRAPGRDERREGQGNLEGGEGRAADADPGDGPDRRGEEGHGGGGGVMRDVARILALGAAVLVTVDRKSTRLNSSHT